MKIAIATDGKSVSQHFGHCKGFQIFDLVNSEVSNSIFYENPGHKPGFLPKFLAEKNVNLIISGGMGGSAQNLFSNNGIEVIVGVEGSNENIINDFINGNLKSSNSVCSKHEHSDSCGGH